RSRPRSSGINVRVRRRLAWQKMTLLCHCSHSRQWLPSVMRQIVFVAIPDPQIIDVAGPGQILVRAAEPSRMATPAASGIDGAVHVLARLAGRESAAMTARCIEYSRPGSVT